MAHAGILGTVLVTVALFGPLYLVTIPDGPWWLVIAVQVLLFRLRGKFWTREDMLKVAAATGAPVRVLPQPVSSKELAAEFSHP